MIESTASLICEDPQLIKTIDEVVQSIDGIRLRLFATIEEFNPCPPPLSDAIVLIHVARSSDSCNAVRLLRMLNTSAQSVPVIVLFDEHDPKQSIRLLRGGAADCLSRPLDLHRLAYLIDFLTLRTRLQPRQEAVVGRAIESLGRATRYLFMPQGGMGSQIEQIQRVAPQNTTVLLNGETGTGKTCLARVIHELSPRSTKPFLVVNCGTLSENLIESELFGHVRGAFTGADRDRTGKFAAVGDGTLLLDEIDALPLPVQTKLLRALEERVFEPVGSNRSCALQARLIVASNRDLNREVTDGRFRADLYYRLNVVAFELPPLRQRRELISPLADRFLTDFAASNSRPIDGFSNEARSALQAYDWPGNIRELRNIVERAVALCAGPLVEIADLPESLRQKISELSHGAELHDSITLSLNADDKVFSGGTLAETKDEAEYARITAALRQHKNNRLRAAAELGISRMTLYKKLHRFGLLGAT